MIELYDYEIYSIPEENFFGELHSLDHMDANGKKLQFSGVLSIGSEQQHFVQNVPIRSYSIEGYGVEDDPSTLIYLSSHLTSHDREYDIWYKLGTPSRQYKCFHDAFQWVATLGKHVVDFLQVDDHPRVGLEDFRHKFRQWVDQRFPNCPKLQKWCQAYGSTDFRKVVHAHISYLWSEAVCLHDKSLLEHPLWDQCGRRDNEMIPPKCAKTIATPHVYECFKNRYFSRQLVEMQPCENVRAARESRTSFLGLPSEGPRFPDRLPQSAQSAQSTQSRQRSNMRFQVGDVISIIPDDEENVQWRKSAKDKSVSEWFGYIHRISPRSGSTQRLFVIWLYRPEDTTISTTDYPVKKELFLSDNCNCHEHELLSSDVHRRHSVQWFSKEYDTMKDFLVRQKYDTSTSSFVTMKATDFSCTCQKTCPGSTEHALRPGDTVYLSEDGVLQPVVVEENYTTEQKIKIRRLRRSNQVQSSHVANELVWTDKMELVSYARIDGSCHVRFFPREHLQSFRIPFPYNQNGAAHCWMLTMRLVADHLEELTNPPEGFHQGPLFDAHDKKMPGLSLFSGIGNLDKGLEAGGAVHFHTSIDMNGRAIQTLRANSEQSLNLWFGSVDDYLHALLSSDSRNNLVAKTGNVSLIAAGSPCPGFSKLQQDWRSEQSLRNAAHVTTFASFLDTYRPEYGFLENVVNMGATRKGFEEELVLSQLVGCLVSMGYQVQQFIMSSWNYGSPQHRNRLIISIAAPGRTPIMQPRPTHGDHADFKSKSVGRLLNGERFGVSDSQPTPFPHVTAGEALGHLPNIGCGIKHPCIRWPDHVLRLRPNIKERRAMSYIPKYPPGVGLEYAVKHNLIPSYLYEKKSEITGKCYKRFKKTGLIGTVVTAPSPHDSRSGPFVHYEQNRCITLEEARIAQGIPEEDVLIGNVNDQFKMVGNAVDRRVSTALGFELRRAVDNDAYKIRVEDEQSMSVSVGVKKRIRLTLTEMIEEDHIVDSSGHAVQTSSFQDGTFDEAHKNTHDIMGSSTTRISFSESKTHRYNAIKTSITKSRHFSMTNRIDVNKNTKHYNAKHRNCSIQARQASGAIISGENGYTGSGFDLRHKPGRITALEDRHVEFDKSSTSPKLARSHKGFPETLTNSLNASPRLQDRSIPVRSKRARDDDGTQFQDNESSHLQEQLLQNKRLKESRSIDTIGQPPVEDADSQTTLVRKTRHSGAEVEYMPKKWNRTVETEIKAKNKRFRPRPYA